jgi:hypothetical protein
MINLARHHVPVGVQIIAVFYLFGAIVLLISLFTNPVGVSRSMADAHGLSPAADPFIVPVVAGIALLIAYGLFVQARWGCFLTLAYLIIFGSVSLWLLIQRAEQPYIGNAIWSFSVLVYLMWKRKNFLETA